MASRIVRLVASALCLLSIFGEAAAEEGKRVALVVGNGDYVHASQLENPKNDASDIASALEALEFKVHKGIDLDKAAMDKLVRDFAEALVGSKVALFFYAGHGLQVSGQNYLVPVDAKLTTAAAIDFEMVRLDLIQRAMEREVKTNIIFLDACRDNPLARNLARALGSRSTQVGRGLANVEAGEGTLISFSTQPGNVALDGTGRNSPFAGSLVKRIATPGDDLSSILIKVRNDVMDATERRQVPWEHSSLTSKIYFLNAMKPAASPVETGASSLRPTEAHPFDGVWRAELLGGPGCTVKSSKSQWAIGNSVLPDQGFGPGNVTLDGTMNWKRPAASNPNLMIMFSGTISGNQGSGMYKGGGCIGQYTLTRQ